jgi:hypothetical protein
MPVFGMMFYLKYMLYVVHNQSFSVYVFLVMAVCTFIFPLIIIGLMKSSKMITSAHMPTKEERRWPLLFGTFFFFMAYMLLKQATDKFSGTDGVKYVAIGGIATLTICTIVNLLYKLSIHMAAVGGVTGMMVAFAPKAEINMLYILPVMVFIAGLVGFARLRLSAHSSGQVAAGYVTGFFSQYIILSVLSSHLFSVL